MLNMFTETNIIDTNTNPCRPEIPAGCRGGKDGREAPTSELNAAAPHPPSGLYGMHQFFILM